MVFLSKLLNGAVHDAHGRRIGQLSDLIVDPREVFPRVTALVVAVPRHSAMPFSSETGLVPWQYVTGLEAAAISLTAVPEEIAPYLPRSEEVYLARDILDKQIVDMQGRRIMKVNDLKLAQIEDIGRLVGMDISLRGFLRRLGAERTADLLHRILPIDLPERLITWNYVEPPEGERNSVRLNVPHTQLAALHPADIADIIELMTPSEGSAVLQSLDGEIAADTLEEVEPATQRFLLAGMDPERLSRILAKMNPDDATDVLGDLPPAKAEQLLALMGSAEAASVRELLQYDEHSAGGIMTTEVFALPETLTAEEAIARLRSDGLPAEMTYYLFVVDEGRRLVGVLSLRQLVTAAPDRPIAVIMNRDVIKVRLDTDQEEVATIIARYDLLALPVVDAQDVLKGLVTVDDVIDVIHEEASEDMAQLTGALPTAGAPGAGPLSAAASRLAWFSVSLIGGIVAALLVRGYAQSLQASLAVAYFIPLLLNLGNGAGVQSLSVVGRGIVQGTPNIWRSVWREAEIATIVGAASGVAVASVAYIWMGNWLFGLAVGASLAATLLVGSVVGALLPVALNRLRLNPMMVSSPVLYPIVSIVSLLVYLSLSTTLAQGV